MAPWASFPGDWGGTAGSHPARDGSRLKSGVCMGEGKGEGYGSGRFGGMTWYISQPSFAELLNWRKNFTQNNHKIWAILQLSAPLFFKPRRERSREDSNGELASRGGSVVPLTRRACSVLRDDSVAAELAGCQRRLPRTSLSRALRVDPGCREAAPLFGCLSCGCRRKEKQNHGLIYISWLL